MRNDLQAAVEHFEDQLELLRHYAEDYPDKDNDTVIADIYATALSALRDALKRAEGCEWCEEENLDVEYYYTLPTAPRSFQTRRNYCHKCGRRLATVSKTERVGQGPEPPGEEGGK